jgi:hypothetical protein
LSDIFADAGKLKEKASLLSGEESDNLKRLGACVDRIVLFVDDLDRCQPDKVVDVLQAVHLLLAFPLFAVVVGVDRRCLEQSIAKQFEGLISKTADAENGDVPAAPLDYLEKIFHVPFHLPAMGEEGFATLIEKLTEPAASAVSTPVKSVDSEQHAIQAREGADAAESADAEPTGNATPSATNSSTLVHETPMMIGSVSLQPWEREALKNYHSLIRTPRGVKRLLNTYRLVRAGIPAKEWEAFRGDGAINGEFRMVMLLLAAAAGYPAVARDWFATLRNADSIALVMDDPERADEAWAQFHKVYSANFGRTAPPPTKELLAKWLDRVERFTF